MKDFFISHNKADKQWAEWIAWQLEEAGYSVTLQAWDFRPGTNFVLKMQKATQEATRTIAVLSPDYLSALYTHSEWAAAFAQDPLGQKQTLLPIIVQECELTGLLNQIVHIDLVNLNEAAAKAQLLEGAQQNVLSHSPHRIFLRRAEQSPHLRLSPMLFRAFGVCLIFATQTLPDVRQC